MIYGTPIVSGVFPFTIQVVDSENPAALATHPYTIAVVSTLAISTASLPAANIGVGYTTTITATGGVVPYTFAVTNGSLPAGLPLNSATGVLAGTPTTGGAFNFTLTASDSAVPQDKSSAPFLIVVGHTVIVQWTASITPGVSYNVYSGITSGGPYTSIGTTSALNFRDPTSTAGNTYYYVVTAFDTNGESGYSNEASAVIPKP
jgi:hypothetical protein